MALELLVRLRGVDGRCVVRLRFMSRGSTRLVRRWRRECDGEGSAMENGAWTVGTMVTATAMQG